MTSLPPPIGGRSFLSRSAKDARASFAAAHDCLTAAESEIERLQAVIEAMPESTDEARRLLRLCGERLRHGGGSLLTDDEVDEVRSWYYSDKRAS